MRKMETVVAFGIWASLMLAADQVGATQTDWRGQIWNESEWVTGIESEEESEKENLDGSGSREEGESEWEDESNTDQETETETETEKHQIILSNVKITEPRRYYDGTDRAAVEAQVVGLPEGMQIEIEGRTQESDAGTWPVEVIAVLTGAGSEQYEVIQEPSQEALEVQILPRPLTIHISNARKSYYSDVTMDNLIFEEKEIVKVTGFLEQDCPDGEVPEDFCYPELEIDESILCKESPMYEKGKPIHYRHAVTVRKNPDGSITGNPTGNYTFYIEETENVEGGDVILSEAPVTGTLDYTIRCTDPSAMWVDPAGTLWVKAGAQIQVLPEDGSGFTDGKLFSNLQEDGSGEFVLTRKNENGEIIAQSQIRSFSWRTDRDAPQAGLLLDGKRESAEGIQYLNRDSQIAVSDLTEYGSGVKSVELYAAFEEEKTISGEALYLSRSNWKKGTQLFLNREGSCRVWIRLEDMVGNVRYQCSGEIVMDRMAPELQFEQITAGSANNGKVTPVCVMKDRNLKRDSLKLTLTGFQNGERRVVWNKTDRDSLEELALQMENLPEKREWDDVYTLKAEAEDLAGNHSSREIHFSVNRFGSVYYIDDVTREQTEQFYVASPASLKIYEVNVDYLTESGILLGHEGETRQLKRGVDYTVKKEGNDGTWKKYCYTISDACFQEEGRYYLICASEDRAWNTGDNRMGKQKIEFAVDKSAPFILLTGVEAEGVYQMSERKAVLECRDNLALQEVTVWLNGEKIREYTQEEQEIILEKAQDWQTLRVVAVDKAGNQEDTGEIPFWIGESRQVPERKKESDIAIQKKESVSEEKEGKGATDAMDRTDKKREEEEEKSTGKNWVIVSGIVVFTALLAILFLRKREK